MTVSVPIDFLANQSTVSGGEVMLVRMAGAAQRLGREVRVTGPVYHPELGDLVRANGLEYRSVPGRNRREYAAALWARTALRRSHLLWCNGLVPSLATEAARARRVIDLHQVPRRRQMLGLRVLRRPGDVLVAPSRFLAGRLPGCHALVNWTGEPDVAERSLDVPGRVRVGFLGRLSPIKGVNVLLGAIQRLEQQTPGRFHLVVGGDDRLVSEEARRPLRHWMDESRRLLTELGWIDRARLFAEVDLLVVPSVVEEAFGLVAAEAMAAGVPVVVSDSGALREVVGSRHPWIVGRGEVEQLAATIEEVTRDPVRTAQVTDAARERWREHFSPTVGEDRFRGFLERMGVG